jgi:hypothetical protein
VHITRLTRIGLVLALAAGMLTIAAPARAQLNITLVGSLGDLDGNGDGGAGEAAVVAQANACWADRVGTPRPFTLSIQGGSLSGGTIGQGSTSAVDGLGVPTAGGLTMDNDGSTTYFVDATPLVSTEFTPDPLSQWRFTNGTVASGANVTDLYSVYSHEVGHALGWLCGAACGFTNPNYDALMNPAFGSFVANASCSSPFPREGEPDLPGCVHLQQGGTHPLDVALRGDGLGGSGSSVVNELSHPGITGDLELGFYSGGVRELQSVKDVDMFAHAYFDTVNLPPTVNAGADILAECSAYGGSSVTLNGSGTTDPENDPLTYGWTCEDVALSGSTTVSPAGFFALDTPTTCRLDVTDLGSCPASAAIVEVEVQDTTPPVITCPPPIVVECSEIGGTPSAEPAIAAFLNGAFATDICDPTLPISNNDPGFFDVAETTPVLFSTQDQSFNSDSCLATVQVVDTTAPTINSVTATPNVLWPVNHKLKAISVGVDVTDICDPGTSCHVTAVTSNEPINGPGDGNAIPDYVITGDLTLSLRAERSGNLVGRVYTIHVECGDAYGNTSTKTVGVTVPHAQN